MSGLFVYFGTLSINVQRHHYFPIGELAAFWFSFVLKTKYKENPISEAGNRIYLCIGYWYIHDKLLLLM